MTAALPILLYDSIGYACRNWARASSSPTATPVASCLDWRYGTRWKPNWTENLIDNNEPLEWAGGASAAPDGWTLTGAGATIARSTANSPPVPPYSVGVTRAGANAAVRYDVTTNNVRGKKYVLGAWVWADAANRVRLSLTDATTTNTSSYHTGGSTWEWLTVSALTCGQSATYVRASGTVITTNGTGYFCGFLLMEQEASADALDQTPEEPQTCYANFYPCSGQKLRNWYFKDWTDGVAADPDSWDSAGSGTVRLSSDAKVGRYAAEFVGSAGGVTTLTQALSAADLALALGESVRAGFWAKTSTASYLRAHVRITARDGTTTYDTTSSYHTGGGSYEWITTAAVVVPWDATAVSIVLEGAALAVTGTFDGPLFHISSDAPGQTPHSDTADYLAIADHNGGTAGWTIVVQGTDTESSGYTTVGTISPTSDGPAFVEFNSASYRYWRIRIQGGAGDVRPELGVVAFGQQFELPFWLQLGWNPKDRTLKTSTTTLQDSTPMGRIVHRSAKRMEIRQMLVEEAEAEEFYPFLAHAMDRSGGLGLPFFLVWDPGDHSDEVLYCWVPDRGSFQSPYQHGLRSDVSIDIEAVDS